MLLKLEKLTDKMSNEEQVMNLVLEQYEAVQCLLFLQY